MIGPHGPLKLVCLSHHSRDAKVTPRLLNEASPASAMRADRSASSSRSFAALNVRQRTLRRPIKLGLPLFVCMRFQDLFHSPSGVLFAFPSRYWFTIGRSRVFSLGGWSPHLQTGFHVSRPTSRTPSSTPNLSRTGLSPTMAALSRALR